MSNILVELKNKPWDKILLIVPLYIYIMSNILVELKNKPWNKILLLVPLLVVYFRQLDWVLRFCKQLTWFQIAKQI